MTFLIPIRYKIDWILHITEIDYQPIEKADDVYPGCPEGVEPTDGFIQLNCGDNPTETQAKINRQLKESPRWYNFIVEKFSEDIEIAILEQIQEMRTMNIGEVDAEPPWRDYRWLNSSVR